jgi:hypothetical protein
LRQFEEKLLLYTLIIRKTWQIIVILLHLSRQTQT